MPGTRMPSSFDVTLRVNGRTAALTLPAQALLLDVLRDRLALKGAKRSCDSQVCGACTVLVDGLAVSACTYLAVEADGREVLTVEGLEQDGHLDAVQQAFAACGAVQCGFCTAGMLMTARALAAEEATPTRETVLHYLRGSLCRCTGYRKIVDAICLAGGPEMAPRPPFARDTPAEPGRPSVTARPPVARDTPAEPGRPSVTRPDSGAAGELRVVGHSVQRTDVIDKVTGRARYVTDMELPGMAHAQLLRSPYAHARIRGIDVSRARAVPGVHAVLTGADLTWCDPYYGPAFRDRPVLAIDVVRYEGEPVVAVAAVDAATAAAALELVEIDWEELPAVTTLEEALAPGAPLVHTAEPLSGHFADLSSLRPRPGTNVCHQFGYTRGDVERALAEADVVVADTFAFPRVQHYAMEPHAAIAAWDDGDSLTVWASTQNPFSVRVELAKMFNAPLGRIRVVVPLVGGGFGSKTYAKLEPITAILARAAGRPVRLAISAEDAFRTVRRCDARSAVRLGFRGDGTLVAVDCHADFDVGAYADIGPRIIQKGTYTATGPYRVAHVRLGSTAVYTNTTPGGAFRGFGVPQLAWAVESLMDEAARRLDRDPVELRRQNLLAHGEEFAPGDTPIDGKFEESLSRAAEAIGWTQALAADRGRGVAMMIKASIAPSVSEAIVRLHADGSVTVLASTVELGQGARTVMAQIAAEVLAVPIERVTVMLPDTSVTPYDQTTSSSRSTTMVGKAVEQAAGDVAEQLVRIAVRALDAQSVELRIDDGAVCHGDRRLEYSALLRGHFGMAGGELIGRGVVAPGPSAAPLGGSTPFWEMAVGAAEVTLDVETGAITVAEYISVADVGRCINPLSCQTQDEGAVVQGLGHTLFEEMVYDGGQLLNGTLLAYRVPRADDVAGRVECRFVENADGPGPFGAKGAGEGSLVPVSPAVGNALARLTGIRFRDLPLTPERVWRALRQHQSRRTP
jgi:CO/xanthine dehydrogenase Mo-binding subunit/aerobic-type carbon monoxide dehydrogenase small subunit (CoxS/CutS family)